MAAEIKHWTGQDANLQGGARGAFTIELDGKVVYSKAETGRFPLPGEIPKLFDDIWLQS